MKKKHKKLPEDLPERLKQYFIIEGHKLNEKTGVLEPVRKKVYPKPI